MSCEIVWGVFRYKVKEIPSLANGPHGTKPLVAPTVLDGTHSIAFCPAPRNTLAGHTVHLEAGGDSPAHEVLHPPLAFHARHLWRVGTIRRPVRVENLPVTRGLHLLFLQGESGRDDYATGTDGDLL